jgi:hypothetical protein
MSELSNPSSAGHGPLGHEERDSDVDIQQVDKNGGTGKKIFLRIIYFNPCQNCFLTRSP